MDDNGRFGFDPEDFEHMIRDATEGLRDAFEGVGRFFTLPSERAGWASVFEDLARRTRTRPETTGEAGDGVWAIYTVSADGGARVEQAAQRHVPGDAGEAMEPRHPARLLRRGRLRRRRSPPSRALSRALPGAGGHGNIRATAQAAPNPLSMPTTVSPAAHDACIASNAVIPSSAAPYPVDTGTATRGITALRQF